MGCAPDRRTAMRSLSLSSSSNGLCSRRQTGLNPRPSHRIFASGNRAGRCRWSANFLGDHPLSPPLNSCTTPYSLQSPSSALKTALLRAAQISSLTLICSFYREQPLTGLSCRRGIMDSAPFSRDKGPWLAPTHLTGVVCASPLSREWPQYIQFLPATLWLLVPAVCAERVHHCAGTSLPCNTTPHATGKGCSRAGMKGRAKREIPEKTRRPTASSGTIHTCENPGVTQLRIEPAQLGGSINLRSNPGMCERDCKDIPALSKAGRKKIMIGSQRGSTPSWE
ncbi:hypothetical protein PR048_021226 [Dryococelus australis]|uniref:Uncharacterized protein n=1 Tax=Dryococelus australis TaxID=614101 RepID=A0ABQ9GXP5_9NEOP|nr:hypothetical protein PR048_021226 [Dryococelus australis]